MIVIAPHLLSQLWFLELFKTSLHRKVQHGSSDSNEKKVSTKLKKLNNNLKKVNYNLKKWDNFKKSGVKFKKDATLLKKVESN